MIKGRLKNKLATIGLGLMGVVFTSITLINGARLPNDIHTSKTKQVEQQPTDSPKSFRHVLGTLIGTTGLLAVWCISKRMDRPGQN